MLRRAPTSKIRRPQRPKQRERRRRRRREQRPKQRLWNPKHVKISSLMQVHELILISKMFFGPLNKKHICLILFSILPCSETCHLRCRFEEGVQHLWILRHGLAEGRLSLTFFESETCYFQLYFPACAHVCMYACTHICILYVYHRICTFFTLMHVCTCTYTNLLHIYILYVEFVCTLFM